MSHATRTPLSRSKGQRSRSPGRFAHRRVGASGGCSGGRENVLAVGNYCYVAVCSAAEGASAPTGGEGRGISWRPPAYSLLITGCWRRTGLSWFALLSLNILRGFRCWYSVDVLCYCFRSGFRTVALNIANKRNSWSSRCRPPAPSCRRPVTAWCADCIPAVLPSLPADRATRTVVTRRCRAIRRWFPTVRRRPSSRRWVAWGREERPHTAWSVARPWCLPAAVWLELPAWQDTDLPQRWVGWPARDTLVRRPYHDWPPWAWTTTLTWSAMSLLIVVYTNTNNFNICACVLRYICQTSSACRESYGRIPCMVEEGTGGTFEGS